MHIGGLVLTELYGVGISIEISLLLSALATVAFSILVAVVIEPPLHRMLNKFLSGKIIPKPIQFN